MPDSGSTLRLQRLRLENWRNFTRVDVALAGRVFLVGPNASGKSNFLDAIRFLHDLVSVGGGFLEAVGPRRGGIPKLRSLAARKYPDVVIHVHVGTDTRPWLWEYELHFSENSAGHPVIRRERVVKNGGEVCLRPDADDEKDPARLTQTCLEQISVNREFRDVADFFRSIRYLHVVPQLVREPDRSAGRSNDPFGGDFLEQIARTSERTRTARLKRIQEALRAAVPQLKELQFYRQGARGTPHLRARYEHWRPRGAWQNEDQFSDGTLRLIGLLWATLDGNGPLLLEEPELSLHPEVVARIPQMFARMQARTGRQAIMSTHAPAILEDRVRLDEILLLIPGPEGTLIRPAARYEQVAALLEQGQAAALAAATAPPDADQLALFPEAPQ